MESNKKVFIGGNWKCNGDLKFAKSHSEFLNSINFENDKCEVSISPGFIHLTEVLSTIDTNRYIVAAQNVSQFDNGAYTGETSAKQLKDLNVHWTLIGHSERRQHFGDREEVIAKKLKISLENGLSVIVCIGENSEERENNKTIEVLNAQFFTIKENVSDWSKIVIAYEPVWAIGTGKTATAEQAQEVHAEIRQWISIISADAGKNLRIIYGGSVTDQNCNELISQKDIDGFLVGGASLKPAFKTIIESYKIKFNK